MTVVIGKYRFFDTCSILWTYLVSNMENLVCFVCEKSFSGIATVLKHLRREHFVRDHSSTPLKCIVNYKSCNKTFATFSGLRKHTLQCAEAFAGKEQLPADNHKILNTTTLDVEIPDINQLRLGINDGVLIYILFSKNHLINMSLKYDRNMRWKMTFFIHVLKILGLRKKMVLWEASVWHP